MARPAPHLAPSAPDRAPGPPAPPAEAAFAQTLVDLLGEAAAVLGIPQSIAAIYAVIIASPRPLSFVDVETRLGLSKGSVSQGLRVLREFGAITVASPPDSPTLSSSHSPSNGTNSDRRDYYVPNMELRQVAGRLLKERIEPQLAGGGRRLNQLVDSVPFADPAAAELVRGRLKHLQSWQRKARKLVPFAKTLLTLG